MGLDVRVPVGLLFTLFGVLLAGYGALSDPAIYSVSMGINVNLDWGVVLFIFGLAMLLLGWRRKRLGAK